MSYFMHSICALFGCRFPSGRRLLITGARSCISGQAYAAAVCSRDCVMYDHMQAVFPSDVGQINEVPSKA